MGEIRLGEMGLGEMGLGEMGQNQGEVELFWRSAVVIMGRCNGLWGRWPLCTVPP